LRYSILSGGTRRGQGLAVLVMKVDVLQGATSIGAQWHPWISAIPLAGGTERVSPVLKYMGYAKENKKNDAASKIDPGNPGPLKAIGRR
jgi:hypothetical protein